MPTHTTVHYRDVAANNPDLDARSFVLIGRAERLRSEAVLTWTGLSSAARDAMDKAVGRPAPTEHKAARAGGPTSRPTGKVSPRPHPSP